MALPPEWFEPAVHTALGQWLGHSYLGLPDSIHPYYIMTALYLAVFWVAEKRSIHRASTNTPRPLHPKARKPLTERSLISLSLSANFSSGPRAGFWRPSARNKVRVTRTSCG